MYLTMNFPAISVRHYLRTIFFCIGSILLVAMSARAQQGYTNPVLRGMNPDPSIVRVGEDFYMVTSSSYLYPGVPVYHSRDLVHWQMIGYCLTRGPQFFTEKNHFAPNMYAATLRYNKGVFYMITTDVAGGGNFFVTATNPAGPWSDPVQIDQAVFDPSLFFDEDKVYYTRRGDFANKDIVQAEIDITTGRLLTPLRSISKGLVSDDTEGPHLFKRNGWYYLTMGEGGSRNLHMQTIARARSPWGPFEADPANPVIAQHHAQWHHIRSLGHADFLDAADGSSWAVCLGTRHAAYGDFSAIGRETFLMPVEWIDDWPVVKPEYRYYLQVPMHTLPPQPWPEPPARDDFDSDTLNLKWNLLAYPRQPLYSLTARRGTLRLKGTASPLKENRQTAFIGTRQKEMTGSHAAAFRFEPVAASEEAGLTAFQSGNYHYDLFVTLRNGRKVAVLRKTVGDIVAEAASVPVQGDHYEMKIDFDNVNYHFFIRQGKWVELGKGLVNLVSTEVADVWSGMFLGLYSTGNGKDCRNPADFYWCEDVFTELLLKDN